MQVPRIFNPRTNPTGPAQNYLQAPGPSVQNTVGDSLVDISRTIRRNQEKAENFDISKRLVTEANELQTDFDARKEAAPLGAEGFTDQINQAYTERHSKILEDYAARGYSRDALRELDLRLTGIRQSYNGQAIAFQDESFKGLVNKETGDAAVQLSQYATANPGAIDSALNELMNILTSRPGIEATDVQQLYDHYEGVILQSAGEGLALYDPQSVVDLLAPEETTTSTVVTTNSGDFNIDSYMAATRSAESTGDDAAKATTSSAYGRYQFLKDTWLETYKQTFPNTGETDAQILAKRANGEVQDAVMKTFTANNIKFLEANQIPVSNASVYLAHFLGQGGVNAVYKSAASTNIREVLDAQTIAANPAVFKKVKTVGDMVEFAESKVGTNTDAGAQTTTVASTRVIAPKVAQAIPPAPVQPAIRGNLPLNIRTAARNEDGSVSTVRTISIGTDEGEVLIPTVIDGKVVSDEEAIKHYDQTGENFGVFRSPEEATQYAEWLHKAHEAQLTGVTSGIAPSATPPPAPYVPVVPGNFAVDRKAIATEGGAMSDQRTLRVQSDIGTVLVPREVDGQLLSEDQALARYRETGEHLGVFNNEQEALDYAKWLYTAPTTNLAPTGNPVLDRMTGAQRLAVLQSARAELNRNQAQNRAGVDVKLQNEMTARMETGEYAGEQATDEEIIAAYGPEVGRQKIAERNAIAEIGPFVKELQQLSPAEMQARLAELKPTDTASPTYATELRAYELAEKAAQQNLELRDKDPAAYVYRQFGNISQMLQNARTPDQRKAAYAALDKAYQKLGVPDAQRNLLTPQMAQQMAENYKNSPVAGKMQLIEQWAEEMPSGMMARTLTQLSKTGIIEDVQLFGALRTYPNYQSLMMNIMTGMDTISKDSSRRPPADLANSAYREVMQRALGSLNPEVSELYKESAAALYVQRGGLPGKQFDAALYKEALRSVVGGQKGQANTGIINMGGDTVRDDTILPPGVTKSQFENWIDGLAVGDLTRLSVAGKPPKTNTGKAVPTQDLLDFGVFVMVAPGKYIIKMNNTGGTVTTGDGRPFIVRISPQTVKGGR